MGYPSIVVRVPATVGSFGGALNSAALALDAYLNVKVTPRLDGHVGVRYFGEDGERVPRDRTNLVVRAMQAALHLKQSEFTGADFEIYSSIPVSVGLGASTAAVLAGLIGADRLFHLTLDEKTLLDLASIYEPRQDNLHAAWRGGFVACGDDGVPLGHTRAALPEDFVLSLVIPECAQPTTASSETEAPGPARSPEDRAVYSRRAATMTQFLLHPQASQRVEFEISPLPTGSRTVPGLEEALAVRRPGILGVFVCGSGPALGILVEENRAAAVHAVAECLARHGVASRAAHWSPSNTGPRVHISDSPQVAFPALSGLKIPLSKTSLIPV